MIKYLDGHAYAYIRHRMCANVHIYFVFALVHIQIYVLSTYTCNICMYIHVRRHAFGHVYSP